MFQLAGQNLAALVERAAENRLTLVEARSHADVLSTLPGEKECDARTAVGRDSAGAGPDVIPGRGEVAQAGFQIVSGPRHEGETMSEVRAPRVRGVARVSRRDAGILGLEAVGVTRGQHSQRFRTFGGRREHVRPRL
jgi:hypothetical protein